LRKYSEDYRIAIVVSLHRLRITVTFILSILMKAAKDWWIY